MRVLAALVTLLAVVSLCAGCWDMRDINDRTPALGVALDVHRGQWQMTVANVRPNGGEATMYTSTFESGVGPTVEAALEDLRDHLAYRLYFGTTRVIAIGSEVFSEGRLGDVLALLHDEREASLSTFLVASTTTGAELLRTADVEHGSVPVRLEREMTTQESLRNGHLPTLLWQALSYWMGPARSVYVPLFAPEPVHGLKAVGMLLASSRRKAPVRLGIEESQTLRLLADVPGRAPLVLPDGSSLRMVWSAREVRAVSQPHPHLALTVTTLLEPRTAPAWSVKPTQMAPLQSGAARQLLLRVTSLTAKLQQAGIDLMRGGEAMRRAGLDPEQAVHVPVHVTVTALIQPKQAVSP